MQAWSDFLSDCSNLNNDHQGFLFLFWTVFLLNNDKYEFDSVSPHYSGFVFVV